MWWSDLATWFTGLFKMLLGIAESKTEIISFGYVEIHLCRRHVRPQRETGRKHERKTRS